MAGHDDDLLDEGLDEGPALGQLALVEELAHVLGVGCDGLHVVEDLPALGEDGPRLGRRSLKALLPLPVVLDAGGDVGHVEVGGLHEVVEPVESEPHVVKLRVDGLKPLALLSGHAVHLLVHDLDQGADVALGEDIGANLADDHLLEAAGIEPGSLAGILAALHDRLADVVGELAALGVLSAERPVARLAPDQPAEQVGASHPAGVAPLGRAGAHELADAAEPGLGDDGGERLVLGVGAPDQSAHVDLVLEDGVDAGLAPELTPGAGDALAVEGAGDVGHSPTGLGQLEDALDDAGGVGVGLQGGPLLGSVLHHDPVVAVGRPAGDPEAARCGLPHPPRDLLGQDIGYPIDTKRSDIHGRLDLKPVDNDDDSRSPLWFKPSSAA